MNLTEHQLSNIRSYLKKVNTAPELFDEMYDHVLSALEVEPQNIPFDMKLVERLAVSGFRKMVQTDSDTSRYKRLNALIGIMLFIIASFTYWLTMEPTVSFWDCGEFIAAAYKLQVGHQPGAPLFLMLGKLFSILSLGDASKVAYWVNMSSVVASGATVMFLFWTITSIGTRIHKHVKQPSASILIAGIVGSLAFAFSDTFWFSAVEAEVYAMSTLFTAIVFWAALKWEKSGEDRWLVFISFMIGLSIGIHLLSLLVIPAVALVYYFRKQPRPRLRGIFIAFLTGCVLIGMVQYGIVQYLVLAAAKSDLLFVNSFNAPFGSGAVVFLGLIGAAITAGLVISVKRKLYLLNLGLVCLTFVLFGYSSYFMIYIRANAKPNINLSNPDNAFSLYEYLGRSGYGTTPLLYGRTFDAKPVRHEERGFLYRKNNEKYEVSGSRYKTEYDKNLLFPRTHSQKPGHADFYRHWLALEEGRSPGMLDNASFFSSWQLGFMYWRYFFWNFAGRQNDIQGQGNVLEGNWISGIQPLDALRLGSQTGLPPSIKENKAHNIFYGLPFIIGLAGIVWLYRKSKPDFLTILSLFLLTGMGIVLYLNQDPLQVRERDYAYVGSFYAFAIFIGFGFMAVKGALSRVGPAKASFAMATLICILSAPGLMLKEGWDDHNRSDKFTALHWAKNYLNSCAPNAILFTNADNDTFPLWYAQEVEGIRTDVRVVCLQFLADDAYISQMKKGSGLSAPLPISMDRSIYMDGVRDYFPFVDYGITDSVNLHDLVAVMKSDAKEDKIQMSDGSFINFLPTKKLRLGVDKQILLDTETLTYDEISRTTNMEWTFNKEFATKADLVLFDILVSNEWKRPIYFATSVSEDTYMGLDDYLHLEGYAYRLLPLVPVPGVKADKSERTHSDVMYSNFMTKFEFSSYSEASYADPETRRVIGGTWNLTNTLAANLIEEGKNVEAEAVMEKSLRELPVDNYAIIDTLNRIMTVKNLYAGSRIDKASEIAEDTVQFLDAELTYISSLSPNQQRGSIQDIRIGMYVLQSLQILAAENKQAQLSSLIERNMEWLSQKFSLTDV
ncbi:uncharacterized protein DUF2723 [Arcticibacter pallidicorallinus]|uniref:Uncharacterized protein DUF2723 n=1 Tax=Arcticibacter pallidicorallinus TaxID=1259464 RepID=A0A2T0TXA9_9SPHI|nr:DUF2723 domain-containing protein [Arcticibacter pallidicorallinus]PRY50301.1 uncharacterized protein DUF2723 [Arcticibacter pallidicorallinus]